MEKLIKNSFLGNKCTFPALREKDISLKTNGIWKAGLST